jgi:hypothetical protein
MLTHINQIRFIGRLDYPAEAVCWYIEVHPEDVCHPGSLRQPTAKASRLHYQLLRDTLYLRRFYERVVCNAGPMTVVAVFVQTAPMRHVETISTKSPFTREHHTDTPQATQPLPCLPANAVSPIAAPCSRTRRAVFVASVDHVPPAAWPPASPQQQPGVYIQLNSHALRLRAFGQFETIQRRLAWPLH